MLLSFLFPAFVMDSGLFYGASSEKAASNGILMTTEVHYRLQCFLLCIENTECLIVNIGHYSLTGYSCELGGLTEESGAVITDKPGFTYYIRK